MGLLVRLDRAAHVLAESTVDLARREPCAIEQDLRAHNRAAARAFCERGRLRIVGDGGPIEPRRTSPNFIRSSTTFRARLLGTAKPIP